MTRHPDKILRTALKKATSAGIPIAVVDDHNPEPEYVKLASLASFLSKPAHKGARVIDRVFP